MEAVVCVEARSLRTGLLDLAPLDVAEAILPANMVYPSCADLLARILGREETVLGQANAAERKMNSRDFCFWLQGLFELGHPETLSPIQVAKIKQHLNLVFKHDIGTDGKCDHEPVTTRGLSWGDAQGIVNPDLTMVY